VCRAQPHPDSERQQHHGPSLALASTASQAVGLAHCVALAAPTVQGNHAAG
jgi:hypothetical protein